MRHIISLALFALLVSSAFAKPGTVRTRDGRSIDGDITETETQVTISTRVASITFNRADIASITYAATIREQYEKRVAALPANAGARSHLDLARWLYENREYELAMGECDKAIALEPNNSDAVVLRQTAQRTMAMEKNRGGGAPVVAPGPRVNVEPAPRTPVEPPRARPVLTFDQINLIRQAELKEGETPRVRLDRDVRKKFMELRGMTAKELNQMPDPAKGLAILREGTPEMKGDVKILTDPASLAGFKRVQPVILKGCASADCHGSSKGGTFVLYNPPDSDAATYTNFYILTQYNPYVAGAVRKSIDRQQPTDSLIVEFGLPRDVARTPHPEVPGFAPAFRADNDPRYVGLIKWIESLIPLEPQYGITFALPGGQPRPAPLDVAATQPTNRPPPRRPGPAPDPTAPPEGNSTPDNQRPGNSSGQTNETLKDIRSRMRPIRGL